jgi:coproporphyrinogen III oxidase
VARTPARSPSAALASQLATDLQRSLVDALAGLEPSRPALFVPIEWERDEGRHGGGVRYENAGDALFNRASVNVSQVHYDDLPEKKLASATALSSIVHPAHPRAPSVHMHISYTEMRDGSGYFRVMADLNPSHEVVDDTAAFSAALRAAAPSLYDAAAAQGDRYFFIPALGRTRGVSHFYVEGYRTPDFAADCALAREIGQATIGTYTGLVRRALREAGPPTDTERATQLAYHTLYLLQVLTLDRGTTSGLLVHDQNDVGILGSLPARVDRALLASWIPRQPPPQDALLRALVEALPAEHPSPVEEPTKRALAAVLRAHYRAHPDALALQASGEIVPPTVDNHR